MRGWSRDDTWFISPFHCISNRRRNEDMLVKFEVRFTVSSTVVTMVLKWRLVLPTFVLDFLEWAQTEMCWFTAVFLRRKKLLVQQEQQQQSNMTAWITSAGSQSSVMSRGSVIRHCSAGRWHQLCGFIITNIWSQPIEFVYRTSSVFKTNKGLLVCVCIHTHTHTKTRLGLLLQAASWQLQWVTVTKVTVLIGVKQNDRYR